MGPGVLRADTLPVASVERAREDESLLTTSASSLLVLCPLQDLSTPPSLSEDRAEASDKAESWLSHLKETVCATVRQEIMEAVAAYENKP
ncbi:hypothetical protein Y1Q_0011501 [Alligator mississippiensis]|uniref:Uncharacterized protein n=1 Tax=Alligator mississippiensis TaxID=8496 RepID=A0A151M003_ALLMI|nr:hypothetical protein Y1Q_0011501 [Alligator mississippiensis]